MGAFNTLHSQAPQTLAHAISDSPTGLLGWNSQLLGGLDEEFVISNIAITWFTGTASSSIRFYYENAKKPAAPSEPTTVPIALAGSKNDFQSIRRFADRDHANIASWNMYEVGDHYSAHSATDVLVADIEQFFESVR